MRHPGAAPSRSDIVLFVPPGRPSVACVERVIGPPGDTIRLTGGRLHINGVPVPREEAGESTSDDDRGSLRQKRHVEVPPGGRERFTPKRTDAGRANNTGDHAVPADHVVVVGDNRDNGADGRFPVPSGGPERRGFVPVRLPIGEAVTVHGSRDRSRILSRIGWVGTGHGSPRSARVLPAAADPH